MHIAAETGLIENPVLPKLDEVQDLRVKLEKMNMRIGIAEETAEAKTNCTICEEMVSIFFNFGLRIVIFVIYRDFSMIMMLIVWSRLHHVVTAFVCHVLRDVCLTDLPEPVPTVEKSSNKVNQTD